MTDDQQLKTILDSDIRAKFKIEIHFDPHRSSRREFKAFVLLMESGKFFHGGGDGQMYLCLDHRPFERDNTRPPSALPTLKLTKQGRTLLGCGIPIPSSEIRGGIARCPGCHMLIKAAYLTAQIPFFGSTMDLVEMVEILFHRLKDDADIYCKFHREEIRYDGEANFKKIDGARQQRRLMIYSLTNIMKDLGAGASLSSRLAACFRA